MKRKVKCPTCQGIHTTEWIHQKLDGSVAYGRGDGEVRHREIINQGWAERIAARDANAQAELARRVLREAQGGNAAAPAELPAERVALEALAAARAAARAAAPLRQQFLEHVEAGRVPNTAAFGGIHDRRCGHRGCNRIGGVMGVRFRGGLYRCEVHHG
jgi:hypothetical protein